MTMNFSDAMRRTTELTRAGDLKAATRLILSALGQGDPPPAPADPGVNLRLDVARMDDIPDAEVIAETRSANAPARSRFSLKSAVDTLSKGRSGQGGKLLRIPGKTVLIPEGARFETRSHTAAEGQRAYRLYIPASAGERPTGLIVMLHGCNQTPEDFALGTGMNLLADQHGFIVAYPGQNNAANSSGCWNWFQPGHQNSGTGEPAILAGIAAKLMAEFAVTKDRAFVAGLSAGGAMAVILGETYPGTFGGVGVHSGLAYESAKDAMSAFAAMRGQGVAPQRANGNGKRPRLIVFHGTADVTVVPANADAILAANGFDTDTATSQRKDANGRFVRHSFSGPASHPNLEDWRIDGAGHCWSGGNPAGSFTDPSGPDASAEIVRFFFAPHIDKRNRP